MLEGSQASWEQAAQNFDEHMLQWIRDIKETILRPSLNCKSTWTRTSNCAARYFRLDNLFFGKEPHHHKMTFIDWRPKRARACGIAFLLAQAQNRGTSCS